MPTEKVTNWFGDLGSHPHVLVKASSVDDIVAVMRDKEGHPAPVRGRGSAHSTTLCGEAGGGTVIDLTGMNKILEIGEGTFTAQAGALNIDVAKELERNGLQHYVNIELGNATVGSLACCATKDASMPGEFGQVNSYCVGMKMVTPSGEILEVTEEDPELLQAARSSYGLFGVVYEATFKVRPLQAMSVHHQVFKLDEFCEQLPKLGERGESMMLYIFPFRNRVGVEFRRYTGPADEAATKPSHLVWRLRNTAWKTLNPAVGALLDRTIPSAQVRHRILNGVNSFSAVFLGRLRSKHTVPTDQMIRYPKKSGRSRYTFSIWAFPEEEYAQTLREYFQWVREYFRREGYRPNILHVGYRIEQDDSSLFSYTFAGRVLTIDPVATGGPGWKEFLEAYNEFCSEHNGKPLFNQSWGITPDQSRKAFGDRLARFETYRQQYDPDGRLLNTYFREAMVEPATAQTSETPQAVTP